MRLVPPSRAALGSTVADIIRNAILGGALKPGEPLHENALARELAVSRSPIREALIQLERERLVVEPGQPARACPQANVRRNHPSLYDPIGARRHCRPLGRREGEIR